MINAGLCDRSDSLALFDQSIVIFLEGIQKMKLVVFSWLLNALKKKIICQYFHFFCPMIFWEIRKLFPFLLHLYRL